MTPPFGKCVWCERNDFTEEHIIGRQFAKAIGIQFPVPAEWGRVQLPERTGIVLNDRVCDTCNKNWMRKIDNKAMRCVGSALEAPEAPICLSQTQQAWVAMWATKVALLLALRRIDLVAKYPQLAPLDGGKSWVSDEVFAAIRKNKRWPPRYKTKVWIGKVILQRGRPNFTENIGSFMVYGPAGAAVLRPETRGCLAVFVLRRFVFYAIGWDGEDHDPPNPTDVIRRETLLQIWPSTEPSIQRPPPEELVQSELNWLSGPEA